MTEIERIIEEIKLSKLSGIAYANSNSEKFTDYIFECQEELAKAIEQFIKENYVRKVVHKIPEEELKKGV